jgi:hypothetical protein
MPFNPSLSRVGKGWVRASARFKDFRRRFPNCKGLTNPNLSLEKEGL